MRLSRDEEAFLRRWMHDEVHYQDGLGPAKRLQLEPRVAPADLAVLIAAAIPDPIDQEQAGFGPLPAEPPAWPWSDDLWEARISEARAALAGTAARAASQSGTPDPGVRRKALKN